MENSPEGDGADSLAAVVLANKLEAIFTPKSCLTCNINISLFIAIRSSPFTSLPLWRNLQCDCDKHLSFSLPIILSLLVASAYTGSVSLSHSCFFFFLLLLSFSTHFKMTGIDTSKCIPISFKIKSLHLSSTNVKTFHSQHSPPLDPSGLQGEVLLWPDSIYEGRAQIVLATNVDNWDAWWCRTMTRTAETCGQG